MSYASYYRNDPRWGTQQYQFAPPPAPTFQPQPGWGGMDYYRAAAISPDPAIYDSTWNRIRNGGQTGVGFYEARHWHRRAYGGLGEINMMLPAELGAAAGYEAYRNWIHNTSLYEPLNADDERQREAMVGLAIAEATRLWQSTGRRMDRYGLQAACEAAAATANVVMSQWSATEYGNSPVISQNDPYALDDAVRYRGRRGRRNSSLSNLGGSPTTIIQVGGGAGSPYNGSGYGGVGAPGYGGVGGAGYGNAVPFPGGMGVPGSLPGAGMVGGSPYGGYGGLNGGVGGLGGGLGGLGGLGGGVGGTQVGAAGYGGYGGSAVGGMGGYGGSTIGAGYPTMLPPGSPYASALPNVGGIVPGQQAFSALPGSTTIIQPEHRRRRRSRSSERRHERHERRRERERRYSDVGAMPPMMGGMGGGMAGGLMPGGLAAGGVGPGFAGYGTTLMGQPGGRYGGSAVGSFY